MSEPAAVDLAYESDPPPEYRGTRPSAYQASYKIRTMPSSFKCIGLFGKYKDPSAREALSGLAEYLRYRSVEVLLGDTTAEEISDSHARRLHEGQVGEHIDLGIVIGGDGTMLHVARSLADFGVPVVGVNMGRLGFLTDIALVDMYEDVGRILDGEYSTEDRLMLHVEVRRDDRVLAEDVALNDMVIGKGELERLIEIRTFVDGEFVTSARSDGVIIATPTGSTAYALSAGGPILTPQLRAIIMVPICPHMLSNRPIALQDTAVIDLKLIDVCEQCAHVSVDGQIKYHLDGDETVRVQRAKRTVTLVRTLEHDHFSVLRAKLGWGEDL